jgi:Fe2+ or Zn2+ uptake regulation protein
MRVKEGTLTPRQTELMEFLWEANEPMTANKMAEKLAPAGWNNVTLFKTVQTLSTDGFLEVAGLEKTVKTYARKLAPTMTKAQYYASIVCNTPDIIPEIIIQKEGLKDADKTEQNVAVKKELEKIIASL